ncbi:MAG TPA: DUF433 domain-containing protein [Candidatus Deferrimicrobium sp.]|nr:DUF433 domain-containing protein [Candidatus Deferrimicrobium sp.]
MKRYRYIEINPKVMFGKPVIKGTRVTVELILKKLSRGLSAEEIVREHPTIRVEHIREAQAFAADLLTTEEIYFAKSA